MSSARDLDELHRLVARHLDDAGQRYTTGRRAIVEVLSGSGPLTLPDLISRHEELTQSSTYRNLAVLEEANVVRRLIHSADHAHFELSEALTDHHHHHLICEECGRVIDVELSAELEITIDTALAALAAAHDFVPGHHTLDLHGHCPDCR